MKIIKRLPIRLVWKILLIFWVLNFFNSFGYWTHLNENWKFQLYFAFHAIALILFLYEVIIDLKSPSSTIKKILYLFLEMPIPKGAKIATIIVLTGNLLCITFGNPNYPFYDVGMFRWSTTFQDQPETVHSPKYYYWENDEPQIVETRKQHLFFLADLWGWGYNNELTFSMNYHYKGHPKNFDFIMSQLESLGVDTLWVGIHTVNYETLEVRFDPDICRANSVNDTSDIYYGPLYIPKYQLNHGQCN